MEAFGSFEFDSPFDPFAIDLAAKKNLLVVSGDFLGKPMRLYVTYLPLSFHILMYTCCDRHKLGQINYNDA